MASPAYDSKRNISPERVERCARIYASNIDAAAALDISAGSFSRLCRKYGIESPQVRRRKRNAKEKKGWRQGTSITDAEPTAEDLEALDALIADDNYAY